MIRIRLVVKIDRPKRRHAPPSVTVSDHPQPIVIYPEEPADPLGFHGRT